MEKSQKLCDSTAHYISDNASKVKKTVSSSSISSSRSQPSPVSFAQDNDEEVIFSHFLFM